MKYRKLITLLLTFIMALVFLNHVPFNGPIKEKPEFRFGVVADCQYADVQSEGVREYALSDKKLKLCVDHLNVLDLKYVVNLGDLIDRDFNSFDTIQPILNQLEMPVHNVLGNHDYSVANKYKKEVPVRLNLPSRYYDFEVDGWRFVVLDGNDISFHAYPEDSDSYKEATEYYKQKDIESPEWNGAIGKKQMNWLHRVLEKATANKEKVIIFCHFPVYPEDAHNLWNAGKVIQVLENYPCVRAYMSGHNHGGNYGMKNGINYLTMTGMVDTEENSYSIVNVYKNRLEIQGFGREKDRVLEIK
ncbi:MAG: metallophosphoesterase [Bacteroidales bacterium]|nr:metallophosphoesterase [Bacteroidales bacterium]